MGRDGWRVASKKKVYKSQFCKQTQCKLSIVSLLWYRLTPNPIIMSTRCRITRRLYVVIKNKPIVCKVSLGFVLFNRCWKLISMSFLDLIFSASVCFTLFTLLSRMIVYFCWFTDVWTSEADWEWVIPFLTLHTPLCLNSPTSQPLVNVGISILAFPLFVLFACVIRVVLRLKCVARLCATVEPPTKKKKPVHVMNSERPE